MPESYDAPGDASSSPCSHTEMYARGMDTKNNTSLQDEGDMQVNALHDRLSETAKTTAMTADMDKHSGSAGITGGRRQHGRRRGETAKQQPALTSSASIEACFFASITWFLEKVENSAVIVHDLANKAM